MYNTENPPEFALHDCLECLEWNCVRYRPKRAVVQVKDNPELRIDGTSKHAVSFSCHRVKIMFPCSPYFVFVCAKRLQYFLYEAAKEALDVYISVNGRHVIIISYNHTENDLL